MGALGSVALGSLADFIGLSSTIILLGFLPLLGLVTFLLPSDKNGEINGKMHNDDDPQMGATTSVDHFTIT